MYIMNCSENKMQPDLGQQASSKRLGILIQACFADPDLIDLYFTAAIE